MAKRKRNRIETSPCSAFKQQKYKGERMQIVSDEVQKLCMSSLNEFTNMTRSAIYIYLYYTYNLILRNIMAYPADIFYKVCS